MDNIVYNGGDFLYKGFSIIFVLFIIIIISSIVTFLINLVTRYSKWICNKNLPILSVDCRVISKRINIRRYNNHKYIKKHNSFNTSFANYYITFEFENKDILELKVSGSDYDLACEGDFGKLKIQGNNFIEFNKR